MPGQDQEDRGELTVTHLTSLVPFLKDPQAQSFQALVLHPSRVPMGLGPREPGAVNSLPRGYHLDTEGRPLAKEVRAASPFDLPSFKGADWSPLGQTGRGGDGRQQQGRGGKESGEKKQSG